MHSHSGEIFAPRVGEEARLSATTRERRRVAAARHRAAEPAVGDVCIEPLGAIDVEVTV